MQRVPEQPIDNPDYVHPRTREQAFGEGGPVEEKDAPPPMYWGDKIVLWVAPVVAIFVIVLLALEK
jgi:hypothetical protein